MKAAMERKTVNKPIAQATSQASVVAQRRRSLERGEPQKEGIMDEEERMEQLIDVLGILVSVFPRNLFS